jgi:hypothetical protein
VKESRNTFTLALVITCSLAAVEHSNPNQLPYSIPQINACLISDTFLNRTLFADAEHKATEIYDGIGVQLEWNCDRVSKSESPRNTVLIRVQGGTPDAYLPGALAFALPFAHHGVRVTLFYDRIRPLLDRYADCQGSLIGHTLAHEIAHVLAGQDAHATTGLMQAKWSDQDFRFMRAHLLTFTPAGARSILNNLSSFQSRWLRWLNQQPSRARIAWFTASGEYRGKQSICCIALFPAIFNPASL